MDGPKVITLQPGTSPIAEYDSYYEFLCVQVLKELNRRQIDRKLKNDSTPVRVEDDLQQSIMTVLQRFRVRDKEEIVYVGYIIQLNNERQDYDVINYILEQREDIQIHEKSLVHHVHTFKIPESEIEVLQTALAKEDHLSTYDYGEAPSNTWVHEMGKEQLDRIRSQIKRRPFTSKEIIDVDIITFEAYRMVATSKPLKDIGIKVADLLPMIWTDVGEEAIMLNTDNKNMT